MNIIAHRGASKHAPQNTLPAFQLAIDMGANGIETDVHLSKDGVLIICHDYTIDGTSNGSGDVNEMTYEELLQYDFGGYKGEEFTGTKIPTLIECLEVCKDLEILDIELKRPRNGSMEIVEKTLALVEDMGLTEKLLLSSFDKNVIVAAKEINPKVKTALIYSISEIESPDLEEILDDPVAYVKKCRADAVHPFALMINEDYIEDMHEAGIEVNPWTINSPESIKSLLDIKGDGVITDVPDIAKQVIDSGV
ncbi:MAG: glycerophosphodiester phosphodiesterase [Oscillospiraceae bacterium]|nr:glycerophosphodiester phosphodiesterase [Oscillospiraceae bacterium]